MKRILAILVAVVGLFTLCFATTACNKGEENTIVVGVTDYEPMDYKDKDGNWTGFDYELAVKTFSDLGYNVKIVEIDWTTKIVTLNAHGIDCIWNGMTITDELKENITLSDVYLENRQYGLVKKENAEKYTSLASLANAKVAVEGGSAAEGLLTDSNQEGKTPCAQLIKQDNQNSAVMEVASDAVDVAVVDYLLAQNMVAQGSNYADKLVAVDLGFEAEEFAIGFRKDDTELCKKVNEKIKAYYADGSILELAEKYGIANQLVASK